MISNKVVTAKELKDLLSQLNDKDEIYIDLVTSSLDLQSIPLYIQDSIFTSANTGNESYLVLNLKADIDIIKINNERRDTLRQLKTLINKNK